MSGMVREYWRNLIGRTYSGTVLGEESFAISPVVVGHYSTSRVDRGSEIQFGGVGWTIRLF